MIPEKEALVVLSTIPSLGPARIKQLIRHFGSAQAALLADPSDLASLPMITPRLLATWETWKTQLDWKQNLERVAKDDVELISYQDSAYPKRLLEIPDHPVLLYMKGELRPSDQRAIAIVGTRQASIYGKEMAEQIASELAAAGFSVISGLARGIDTAAHIGALKRGRTIGVIGSGLANVYPKENLRLSEEIAANGALISEFSMTTPPDRQNFPQRNRIVAGMSLAVLLIEAPIASGAMLTMERAKAYNRPLFALPGRVDNENFTGNHQLIKTGKAQLVEGSRDIIAFFDTLLGSMPVLNKQLKDNVKLTEEEQNFLTHLPNQEISIDSMIELTKLPMMKINSLLMSLLLKKALREFPGKIYKKMEPAS